MQLAVFELFMKVKFFLSFSCQAEKPLYSVMMLQKSVTRAIIVRKVMSTALELLC